MKKIMVAGATGRVGSRFLRRLLARVMRFAFVYGEGDPHLRESLMWARDWPAHQRLQLVHHADVGQALLRVLRAEGIGGRVYHVGDDAPVSAVELHARLHRPRRRSALTLPPTLC